MAVVIPEDFHQVTFLWRHTSLNRDFATVFGGAATASASLVSIAETWVDAWDAELKARTDASLQLRSMLVRQGPNSGPLPGDSAEIAVGVNGTLAFESSPVNCCLLVKKTTLFGGRANRGRSYWPGLISDTDVSEVGIIGGATVTAIQTDISAFLAAVITGNGTTTLPIDPVILHDETSPTTAPTPIQSLVVQNLIATQRRRIRP